MCQCGEMSTYVCLYVYMSARICVHRLIGNDIDRGKGSEFNDFSR
jgi:hypothetical protein